MNRKRKTPPIDLRPKVFTRAHDGGRSVQYFPNMKERQRSSAYWVNQLAIKTDVVAVSGIGAVVSVENGVLCVKQGSALAGGCEIKRYPKGEKIISYIIVDSCYGYITIDAILWCVAQNVGVIIRGHDPLLIHSPLKPATDLRRRQYYANPLAVSKWILKEKFLCMLRNFPDLPMYENILESVYGVGLNAGTIDELRLIEGRAAVMYWRHQSFTLNHFARFPDWWHVFDQRASNFGGNKNATHPP